MKHFNKYFVLSACLLSFSGLWAQNPTYRISMDAPTIEGSSSTLTFSRNTLLRPGKVGKAYIFQSNYNQSNVAIAKNLKLSTNGVYSISCWINSSIYPEFYPDSMNVSEYYIMSKEENGKEMDLVLEKGGTLAFRSWYSNDAYDEMVTSESIPVNRWMHVTVTVDWNNKIEKMYINGIEKTSKVLTSKPLYNQGRTPLYFGDKVIKSVPTGRVLSQFDGAIDEVKIYDDQILTPDFIMAESSVNVEPDHCWTFNEDWYVNNRIKDFQGFDDLKMTGNVEFAPGKIGSTAISLTKDYQYLCTQKPLSVSDNGNYCVGGWVYPTAYNGDFINSNIAGSNTNNVFCMSMNSSGTMTAKVWGADGTTSISLESGVLPLKTWSNIMLQVDNTAHKCILYVNGKSVKEMTMTFTPNLVSNNIVIGAAGSSSFRGMIDDVSLYRNRILTMDDITWLANKTELRQPLYSPVYIEDHGQTSHRQVGYEPKFIAASEFSFDSKNRPYNRNIDYVQYMDDNGEWHRTYFKDFVSGTINSNSWQDDNRIVFDNDDWAYTVVRVGNNGYILYSQDYCRTWKVLDVGCQIWDMSWEARSVHNNLKDPPVLMCKEQRTFDYPLNASLNKNELFLLFFVKDGKQLKVDQNVSLGINGNTNVHHSGGGCQIISTTDKVFVTYSEQVGDGKSTPIYARTINKDYFHTMSDETLMTTIGDSYDGHNYASIEMDKDGCLLAVVTGHHHQMQYLKSKKPYSTDEWENATSPVSGRCTYGALVMDKNETLHLITRYDVGYTFSISESTKDASGNWTNPNVIVSPRIDNYHVPTHHLVIDRNGNIYATCAYNRQQVATYAEVKSLQMEYPELNISMTNVNSYMYGVPANIPFYQAETYILPAGETQWKLATSEDFMNNMITTGILTTNNAAERNISIHSTSEQGKWYISNIDNNTSWKIYTIDGTLQQTGTGHEVITSSISKGLLILKVGNSAIKFINQ